MIKWCGQMMNLDKAGGISFDFEIVVDVKMWCGGGCRHVEEGMVMTLMKVAFEMG